MSHHSILWLCPHIPLHMLLLSTEHTSPPPPPSPMHMCTTCTHECTHTPGGCANFYPILSGARCRAATSVIEWVKLGWCYSLNADGHTLFLLKSSFETKLMLMYLGFLVFRVNQKFIETVVLFWYFFFLYTIFYFFSRCALT